jgi:LIVCS family branched-chain amino acid:cation transporter
MKTFLKSDIVLTGLAIFSMLFGAGNLMYPLRVGMSSGDMILCGILGFILTAVCLPVAGFIGMLLFNGDYTSFFNRLGSPVGSVLIGMCMLIIGPMIVIPRLTTLSHTMIAPFIPWEWLQTITPLSSFIFALGFLGITFLLTFKENRIVDVLGYVISPLLLVSLAIIILKGLWMGGSMTHNNEPALTVFKNNLLLGYQTLDLLGALFFSSIILSILKSNRKDAQYTPRQLAFIGLQAGLVGVSLLGIIYAGMSVLGVFHGHGLANINEGELFREISFRVLGTHGAAIIATAVLMACLSTAIALAAVVGEYLHSELLKKRLGYVPCLALALLASLPLSVLGLNSILGLTGGWITYVGYPVLIALTACNIAYKMVGFTSVKLPVAITFIVMVVSYLTR